MVGYHLNDLCLKVARGYVGGEDLGVIWKAQAQG